MVRGDRERRASRAAYAPALARALVALVPGGASGTLNVVGPRVLERAAFARIVCDAFGLDAGLIVERRTEELGLAARRPLGAGL